MRYLGVVVAAAVSAACLAGCQTGSTDQVEIAAGSLPPITPTYRTRILDWARGFYADPHSLRATEISDPVLIRDRTGRLLWLVCIQAEAHQKSGGTLGPQLQAFGFAPNFVSLPLERNKSTLVREDCSDHPLVWHAWPQLARV